jgi:transposase
MTAETTGSGEVGPGRGGRMSRQRKTAAVPQLLRGEDLEAVSRAPGATAATLSGWRDAFLAAGEAALATRPGTGEELEMLSCRPVRALVPPAAWSGPLERVANDGVAQGQSPAHDEAEGRGHGVERQQPRKSREAQREREAERASRRSLEPGADAGQRRADPFVR